MVRFIAANFLILTLILQGASIGVPFGGSSEHLTQIVAASAPVERSAVAETLARCCAKDALQDQEQSVCTADCKAAVAVQVNRPVLQKEAYGVSRDDLLASLGASRMLRPPIS